MKIYYEKVKDKKGWIWFVGRADFPESFRVFKMKLNAEKYHKTLTSTEAKYLMQLPIQESLHD